MSATPVPGQAPPTESSGHETQLWLLRAAKAVVVLVYVFVLIDLVLLTLAFFLRLFGASIDAEFTQWVYRSADRVMEPFRGIFPTHALSEQSVLDVSLLFAMIVYAILGIALHGLIVWLTEKIGTLRQRQRVAAMHQPWTDVPAAAQPPMHYAPPPAGAAAGPPPAQAPPR
jgi:uncharacterized protein YggT (Ycf19 family)